MKLYELACCINSAQSVILLLPLGKGRYAKIEEQAERLININDFTSNEVADIVARGDKLQITV